MSPADQISFLKRSDIQQLLVTHKNADPHKLLLNPPLSIRGFEGLFADQLISRKKARIKLPDWWGNKRIIFPSPRSVEQSSSDLAAEYKRKLVHGMNLIDLTGGMGIDCIALSKNFGKTTYVEQDTWLCEVFKHNLEVLGKEIKVENMRGEDHLASLSGKQNLTIYIDPDRRPGTSGKVFRFQDSAPNVLSLLPVLKASSNQILIKASPLIDISAGISELGRVDSVHIITINNEVKEVLFLLKTESNNGDPILFCADLNQSMESFFSFSQEEEKQCESRYSDPLKYIYEPNNAILKAGGFKLIASKFNLFKIAANTHFYTSNELNRSFPGRIFEIGHLNPHKKELSRMSRINVIARNFGMGPTDIKKKYGLKDGEDVFLICFRNEKNKGQMAVCSRVV